MMSPLTGRNNQFFARKLVSIANYQIHNGYYFEFLLVHYLVTFHSNWFFRFFKLKSLMAIAS